MGVVGVNLSPCRGETHPGQQPRGRLDETRFRTATERDKRNKRQYATLVKISLALMRPGVGVHHFGAQDETNRRRSTLAGRITIIPVALGTEGSPRTPPLAQAHTVDKMQRALLQNKKLTEVRESVGTGQQDVVE